MTTILAKFQNEIVTVLIRTLRKI